MTDKRVPSDEHLWRQEIKNGLLRPVTVVSSIKPWIFQCSGHPPGLTYVNKIFVEEARYLRWRILEQHSEIHQGSRPAPWRSIVSFRDQPLGAWSVFQENKYGRRQKDQSREGLAWAQAITRNGSFPRLRQLLLTIYPESFSRVAAPLNLMLKATGSLIPRALGVDDDEVDGIDGGGEALEC